MKPNIKRSFKRRLCAILSAVIVLSLLSGVVSYAEFTKSNRAKRVIASVEAEGALFSSNYMLNTNTAAADVPHYDGTPITVVNTPIALYTGSSESSVITTVTICNFAQSNPAKFYERPINYTLTASLVWAENGQMREASADEIGDLNVKLYYKGSTTPVTLGKVGNDPAVISSTFNGGLLLGDDSHSDTLRVEFSPGFNNQTGKVRLYLNATPAVLQDGITKIDALLYTALRSEQQSVEWSGRFNETSANVQGGVTAPLPPAYDGFRYVIEGTGIGTVKLKWDPRYLTPSKMFISEMREPVQTETSEGVTWSYISFPVNSNNVNRYDTQFYYAPDVLGTINNWLTIKNYVKCEYQNTPGGQGGETPGENQDGENP